MHTTYTIDHHPALDIHRVCVYRKASWTWYIHTYLYTHTHVMLYIYLDRCSRRVYCVVLALDCCVGSLYMRQEGVEGSNRQVPERVGSLVRDFSFIIQDSLSLAYWDLTADWQTTILQVHWCTVGTCVSMWCSSRGENEKPSGNRYQNHFGCITY